MDFLIGFIQGSVAVAIGYVAGWLSGKNYGIKRAISEAVICGGTVVIKKNEDEIHKDGHQQ